MDTATIILVDDLPPDAQSRLEPADLLFQKVIAEGPLLTAAYRMMTKQFAVDVLDPLSRYVEWLRWNREGTHPFPHLIMAAGFEREEQFILAGVLSGNLMPLGGGTLPGTGDRQLYMFAIGHQVTSPALRHIGFRGVGKRLWQVALDEGQQLVSAWGGVLAYTLLEAEPDSVGFWSKLGYLWPKGSRYWQPPLEFDGAGAPVHDKVPEMLLLKPLLSSSTTISKAVLKDMVATAYNNWCLHKFRHALSAEAFRKAERLVLDDILGAVMASLPPGDEIPLATPTLEGSAS